MMKVSIKTIAVTLFLSGVLAPSQAHAAVKKCDRACLIATVDKYLAAVVAHDPSKVRFSPDVKFVENITPMKPGEGLWKTASALPTTFKIYVPDPVSEQVGFLGVMQAGDKPIELALRLQITHGQITEAEHLIAPVTDRGAKNLQTPRPGLLATVPPSERVPREEMLKIGSSYYEALVTADANDTPFADDCVRRENGMQTTSNPPPATPGGIASTGALGCAAQLRTHTFDYIKRIEPRRVWIADSKTGLVFGLSQFRHPMEQKFVKIVGVAGVDQIPMDFKPFDLPAAHIFKISDGKIHEIEAMGFRAEYNSKTGWEQYDAKAQ
jgi:hypothetical protein